MTALAESIPSDLQLGDQIGKGSYGSVYTAQYGQRQVAVKAVPLENSAVLSAVGVEDGGRLHLIMREDGSEPEPEPETDAEQARLVRLESLQQ